MIVTNSNEDSYRKRGLGTNEIVLGILVACVRATSSLATTVVGGWIEEVLQGAPVRTRIQCLIRLEFREESTLSGYQCVCDVITDPYFFVSRFLTKQILGKIASHKG